LQWGRLHLLDIRAGAEMANEMRAERSRVAAAGAKRELLSLARLHERIDRRAEGTPPGPLTQLLTPSVVGEMIDVLPAPPIRDVA
jgi:hypothetical protein